MAVTVALPFVFCLSGAAGLIFEIVWFHRAGLVFGNGVVAAAVVLSSFMAGLAIGNAIAGWLGPRVRRLLPAYAALEATIAVTGVALTSVLPRLAAFHVPIALAFLLLLIPASAMGATLPLLVAVLRRLESETTFGWALGTLYGWNTFGAVAGALAAETFLIAAFGIAGSAWTAAALDLIAGAAALWVANHSHVTEKTPAPTSAPSLAAAARPVMACAFLSGLTLLALEVIWFRFLSMYVLTTTLVMSVMLAVVLTGIALGGLAAAWWTRRRAADAFAPATALAGGIAVALSYASFNVLTSGTQTAAWTHVVWFAAVMTLPASLFSGILFTLLGASLRRTASDDARAAASLTLANTVGAACGAPIATFLLLPALGTERAMFTLAAGYAVIAAIAWFGGAPRPGRAGATATGAAAMAMAAALALFPFGLMATAYLPRLAQAYAADGSQIVETREGPLESIVLMQQLWMGRPIYSRLVTNGFSMSGTAIPGQRYMRYFVYWPMLVHETPLRRILVICYGAGVTAGAAVDVPTATSIDIVELSRDIAATSDRIYAGGRDPLRDPRVNLHIGDGRHFLQTTAARFDLITGEPPPPRTPGAVNIYTREYFRLIRGRLADGGIATYWLPVARPSPGTNVDTIVRAFCEVFDDCSLWNATPFDLMLAGSRGGTGRFDPSRFDAVKEKLAEVGFETPEQIGATFLGDAAYLSQLTARTPPLTDDFPQRLRPAADRPSLSDPRYPRDLAVVAAYQRVMDPVRARADFARSPLIRRLWPADLVAATLPRFDEQGMINRVLWEGGKPLRLVSELHAVLTRTSLRTLPLWMLGTDAVKQRIAAEGNDGTGTVEYLRGAQLLADRDYEGAASYFGLAARRGLRAPIVRPMIAFASCLAGKKELSAKIVDALQPGDDDERHFVGWMRERCRAGTAGEAGRAGAVPPPAPPAL